MDNITIKELWTILEPQKCKECIFFDHCDKLSSNYKNDICQTIQNEVEEMED